jgi:group I intron endonuclease
MTPFQVYKITNRMTGMSYIGVTSKPLYQRQSQHRGMAERGLTWPLAVAIRQDGWENFETTTVVRCASKEEAYQKERDAIALYNTLVPNGYNSTPGGPGLQGRVVSAVTRAKLRQANLGKKFTQTPEAYAKLCARAQERRGSANLRARSVTYHDVTYPSILDAMAATGLSRGQMTNRLRAGLAVYAAPPKAMLAPGMGKWNIGKTHSAETKAKMSAARSGAKNWNARAIELDGVVYACTTDAQTATGLTRNEIRGRIKRGDAKYLTALKHIH